MRGEKEIQCIPFRIINPLEGMRIMYTVNDVFTVLCDLAPLNMAIPGDPVGLITGRKETQVDGVLLALDITPAVIDEALERGANIIVSHHNPFRDDYPRATNESKRGEMLLRLIENEIATICMHTNLDAADGGVSDVLALKLGLHGSLSVLNDTDHIGRIGALVKPVDAREFALHCKQTLGCGVVRIYDAKRPALMVAVSGGGGGNDLIHAVRKGCDTFVTADIKHSLFLEAAHYGINLLDCGHYSTENVIIPALLNWLEASLPGLELTIFSKSGEPFVCL